MITNLVHQSVDGFICGPNGEFDWPVFGAEMSSCWPTADEHSTHPHDLESAKKWPEKPEVVVSTTLTAADWGTRVVASPAEPADVPGDKIMFGGSSLAASLTERDMIDEYLIFVHPVVLGGGKTTFANPAGRVNLDLLESRVLDAEVVLLRYQR